MPAFIPLTKKFEKSVVVATEGCWSWRGKVINNQGYPMVAHMGKLRLVHRVSWELHRGPIPRGLCVLHRCDNRMCSNPEHLFLGTHSDNMHDAWDKGRMPRSRKGGYGRSGVKGVVRFQGRWRALVWRPKLTHVGLFSTVEEARLALEKYHAKVGQGNTR